MVILSSLFEPMVVENTFCKIREKGGPGEAEAIYPETEQPHPFTLRLCVFARTSLVSTWYPDSGEAEAICQVTRIIE